MKLLKLITFYLLVAFSCIVGAVLANKTAFQKEIIFLIYVALLAYASAAKVSFGILHAKTTKALGRLVYLLLCVLVSFILLRTPDSCVLKKELTGSVASLQVEDVKTEPSYGGYWVFLKIRVTNSDQFVAVINKLGYNKFSLDDFSLSTLRCKDVSKQLWDNQESWLLFVNDQSQSEFHILDNKYIVFNTGDMVAYYEHLNYKGTN